MPRSRGWNGDLKGLKVPRLNGDTQAIAYASNQFRVNFFNHVEENFDARLKRYVSTLGKVFMNYKWPKGQKRKAVLYVTCYEDDNRELPNAVPMQVALHLVKLRELIREKVYCPNLKRESDVLDMMGKMEIFKNSEYINHKRAVIKNRKSVLAKIEISYSILRRVNAWRGKGFSITPLCSLGRKHVTIDDRVFRHFFVPRLLETGYFGDEAQLRVKNDESLGRLEREQALSKAQRTRPLAAIRKEIVLLKKLRRETIKHWTSAVSLGEVFNLKVPGKSDEWNVTSSVKTDGYSFCHGLYKEEKALTRKHALMEGCLDTVPPNRASVGNDMGVKNIHYVATEGYKAILTGSKYYIDGHINKHKALVARRQKREAKDAITELGFCNSKTYDIQFALQYVRTVATHKQKLKKAFGGKEISRSKMDVFIHKAATLDRFVNRVKKHTGN